MNSLLTIVQEIETLRAASGLSPVCAPYIDVLKMWNDSRSKLDSEIEFLKKGGFIKVRPTLNSRTIYSVRR